MNKITKKLFCYFTVLLVFFAITAYACFLGVFRYYTLYNHEQDLKARAETICAQLEQFLEVPADEDEPDPRDSPDTSQRAGRGQGRGAYLRFINDIAMADAYILDADGRPFTYGRHGIAGNIPGEDVLSFSARVFSSGSYERLRQTDDNGNQLIFTGVPVFRNHTVILTVIIRDTARTGEESFVPAITVLGGCLFLTLLLSGIPSILLSRRFVKPIQQIAAATRELTRGNYQTFTNVHDSTELGELALETDLLAKRLESARRESRRLEQMQKNYISNISHELRTPVTVIRSSLEAICDGVVTGEKAAAYQCQMLAECISLQRLVNDMLELSRLQNNDFPIEKESMDLLLALDDAIRAVRVIAKNKSIQIEYVSRQEEWLIEGDYGRLRQMFVAALENAIKYSPEGALVLVTAAARQESFLISIEDRGCGIPPEDLEHIFDRFYRCRQTGQKGSGLGLAIIKSIGERHQIAVSLQSVFQKGTCIIFQIPADSLRISSGEESLQT